MRIGNGLATIFLLAPVATHAQETPDAPVQRPAIREVVIDNRGTDDVIVVLSRPSAAAPYFHASKLPPGGGDTLRLPDLSTLFATVIRRSDVKRAELAESGGERKDDSKDNRRALLGLGLALAKGGGNKKKDRDGDEHAEHDEHDDNDEQEYSSGHDDDYGRPKDEPRDENPSGYQLLLGAGKDRNDNGRNDHQPPPDARVEIKAADGDGTSIVNDVAITVVTGTAPPESNEAFDEYGRPRGSDARDENPGTYHVVTGNYLGTRTVEDKTNAPPPPVKYGRAVSVAPAPVNSGATNTSSSPCFCGPDVTAAYVVALKRAHDRIKALPDSETGPWDGAWFLSRNAGSMDEIARGVPLPGKSNEEGDAGANMLCPSGPCGDLPGAGSGTLSICGVCLPKHVGNDIMYGFVGYLLGVPTDIQNAGGHWAQLNTAYSSWDPPQSRAAYAIGRNIAALESPLVWGGVFNEENVCKLFSGAAHYTGNEITTPVKRNSAVEFIQQTYPALADCPRCPADATQPGTLLRDWTTSTWTLDDGTIVYPPDYDPNAPTGESE